MHPTLAATASASWPSRSVCSRSACAIATQGVVSADAKRPARRRRGVSSAQRRAATRSPHVNATRAVEATTRAVQSAVGHLLLHLGVPHRSIEPHVGQQRRHRFVGTSSLPPSSLQSTGGVSARVRSCRSACGTAYHTSARMRSTAASDVAIYDPSRRNLRPLASQIYA